MHCPKCDSTNIDSWDFDVGIDAETGYHDAGIAASCRDCKYENVIEKFLDEGDTHGTS